MKLKQTKTYVGIDNDIFGGMTDSGKVIRDAWIFELIPETETCKGWNAEGMQQLWDRANTKWSEYGFLVSNLPPEIRERFDRIQNAAIERARANGWNPERDVSEDEKDAVGPQDVDAFRE